VPGCTLKAGARGTKIPIMAVRGKNERDMPDVPDLDFVDTLAEVWFAINYAAYHLAYTRVYLQTQALQTHRDEILKAEQAFREMTQVEVVICRAHLAAFFWQVDHVFEALHIAIKEGQKEHSDLKYFWLWGKRMEEVEALPIYREINAYRNKSHELAGIIGTKWQDDGSGPKFIHHFLPTIDGHEPKEDVDINRQLQDYFEFAANVWLSFAPGDYKERFPRNFKFLVTIPHSYTGELPPELKGIPQFEVQIVANGQPARAGKDAHTK
jgi:hypothetical protein